MTRMELEHVSETKEAENPITADRSRRLCSSSYCGSISFSVLYCKMNRLCRVLLFAGPLPPACRGGCAMWDDSWRCCSWGRTFSAGRLVYDGSSCAGQGWGGPGYCSLTLMLREKNPLPPPSPSRRQNPKKPTPGEGKCVRSLLEAFAAFRGGCYHILNCFLAQVSWQDVVEGNKMMGSELVRCLTTKNQG